LTVRSIENFLTKLANPHCPAIVDRIFAPGAAVDKNRSMLFSRAHCDQSVEVEIVIQEKLNR